MSGSKTKVGFSGGSDPPDAEESRAARTLYGHDLHLRLPAGVEPPRFPVAPAPVPPALPPIERPLPRPRDIEFAEESPRRGRPRPGRGDSRLARILGRWSKSGHFLSRSRLGADTDDPLSIPRSPTGRNVLLVLLVALFAFAITFAVVKLRQGQAPAPAAPAIPARLAPAPPLPPPAPPAPPPAATAPPSPAPAPVAPAAPIPAAAKGLGVPAATGARRVARPGRPLAEPPSRLKTELLPLGR